MQEMGGSPEINEIACLIDNEVRLGALEIKGAWSKGEAVVGYGWPSPSRAASPTP